MERPGVAAERAVRAAVASLAALPFPDASFDGVFAR